MSARVDMHRRLLPALLVVAACVPGAAQEPGQPIHLARWRVAMEGIEAEAHEYTMRVKKDGWLTTASEYLDFALPLRFRVMTADAEGALLLRAFQTWRHRRPATGYRLVIAGPAVKKRPKLVTGFSTDVKVVSGSPTVALPTPNVGEWRQLEVVCRHDRLTVRVDGQEIGVVEGLEPQAGTIGIESRKGVIEYADISLTPDLIPGIAPAPPSPSTGEAPEQPDPNDVITPPQRVVNVTPRYSLAAMAGHIEGHVVLELTVKTDGSVQTISVLQSVHNDLDLEAIAAARRWQFTPALRNGNPIPFKMTLTVNFTMPGRRP